MTASLASFLSDIERATEGSRNFDERIWSVVHGRELAYNDVLTDAVPAYTRSLDAALTLWGTPELDKGYPRRGINLMYSVLPGGKLTWRAIAWEIVAGSSAIAWVADVNHRCRPISACIAALCAASLRARMEIGT